MRSLPIDFFGEFLLLLFLNITPTLALSSWESWSTIPNYREIYCTKHHQTTPSLHRCASLSLCQKHLHLAFPGTKKSTLSEAWDPWKFRKFQKNGGEPSQALSASEQLCFGSQGPSDQKCLKCCRWFGWRWFGLTKTNRSKSSCLVSTRRSPRFSLILMLWRIWSNYSNSSQTSQITQFRKKKQHRMISSDSTYSTLCNEKTSRV